jgi:hypothetical protein
VNFIVGGIYGRIETQYPGQGKLTELIHTILVVKNDYPKVEYSWAGILSDIQNILLWKFAEKWFWCKYL